MKILKITSYLLFFFIGFLSAQTTNWEWRTEVQDSLNGQFRAPEMYSLDTAGQIPSFLIEQYWYPRTDLMVPLAEIFPFDFDGNYKDSLNAYYDFTIFIFGINFGPFIFPTDPRWEEWRRYEANDEVFLQIGMYAAVAQPKSDTGDTTLPTFSKFFKVISNQNTYLGIFRPWNEKYYYPQDTIGQGAFDTYSMDQIVGPTMDRSRSLSQRKIRRSIDKNLSREDVLQDYDLNQDRLLDSLDQLVQIDGVWYTPWEDQLRFYPPDLKDSLMIQVHLVGEPRIGANMVSSIGGPIMTFGAPFDTILTYKIKPPFGGQPLSAQAIYRNGDPVTNGKWYLAHSNGPDQFLSDENGQIIIPSSILTEKSWLSASPLTRTFDNITTMDLIKIQKHIVGIEPFTDPYQLLAADANRSNSVTVGDIIELRKKILGRGGLGVGAPWYVIDADYEFSNPKEPWLDKWPDRIPFTPGNATSKEPRFIVVLLGDVN
ncbi:MAG: hypothetical protein AAF705_21675 [Bacteroidota bacterium]